MGSREKRHATTISRAASGHVSTQTNSPVGEREIKIRQGNCAASGNLTGEQGERGKGELFAVRRGETLSFGKLEMNGETHQVDASETTRADA